MMDNPRYSTRPPCGDIQPGQARPVSQYLLVVMTVGVDVAMGQLLGCRVPDF